MELWQAIIANAIGKRTTETVGQADIEKLFEKECYKVLERIKSILDDDSLCDKDCFEKIEKIVCLFEDIGSDGGARHDFG